MNHLNRALTIPERISLVSQTATAIRKCITEGNWDSCTPSERALSVLLRVSRPTVRKALKSLAEERFISICHGRRNRILRRKAIPRQKESRLVVIVTHEPVASLTNNFYTPIADVRADLAEHGFATEICVCEGNSVAIQRRQIERFLQQNKVFCCILLSLRHELQTWIDQSGIPALVVGSCPPTVNLPSIDIDYRSVCRHAAGILVGRGHRRLAFIVPDSGLVGDLESEQGFREGTQQQFYHKDITGHIVRHNGTPKDITSKLDALLDRRDAPTALLVAKPHHVILIIVHLLRRGHLVPESISVIARDQDRLFAELTPPISHYRLGGDEWQRHVKRDVLRMVKLKRLPAKPSMFFPRLFAGATVKDLNRHTG